MSTKTEKIDNFLKELIEQNVNDYSNEIIGEVGESGEMGNILTNFSICCKKCGSIRIFVSWESGVDYGGYTGYSAGQKLFKCLDCGNAASFWE